MSADLMAAARLSWRKVAVECSRRLGRKYSGAYCREVAVGFRNSESVAPVLRALGVMPAVAASNPRPSLLARMDSATVEQALSGSASKAVANIVSKTLVLSVDTADRLLFQRRTLARHLLESLRESRALRAELEESQSRAAATALRLGNEITEKLSKIEKEYARVDAERACLELELSQTRINLELEVANARIQLEESRLTNDRLIARLSKQSRTGRVTHIRLGNELFRNRTGARA